MHIKRIQQYFKEPIDKIESTNLGLSNNNYKVYVHNQTYMVRMPKKISENFRRTSSERQALLALKNREFLIPTIYYDDKNGILITPFLEDLKTYQEEINPNKIEVIAAHLKKLRSLHLTIDKNFEPLVLLQSFEENIKNPLFDLSPFQFILQEIPNHFHPTLCHNDCVDGNLVFQHHKFFLIDFEFAANNDPLFDIMSFFSENQIDSPMDRKRFYNVYFKDEKIPYQQLQQWENYQNYLWCTWAMMMYEDQKKEIYKEIATWKYHRLISTDKKL